VTAKVETVAKQDLATIRAGYRELRRVLEHGPSYLWRRYVAPGGILKRCTFHTDEVADVTVCVLTSSIDWLMCLWSLASFYNFSGLRLPLLIYSDGTLKSASIAQIKSVFPNARIVDPAEAEASGRQILSEFPNCRRFRLQQPCARRIIDLPILCKSKSILMLDSDILFFRRPEELVECVATHCSGRFIFERDMQDAYFESPENIHKTFQVEVASQVNCGIMVADVSNFDYAQIERWLGYDGIGKHPWAEQTLWAMYAGKGRTKFLSEPYDVSMSASIAPEAVMKHYIKPIRDYIYTQGIPSLSRYLELTVQ
jgi:hypothetical protein